MQSFVQSKFRRAFRIFAASFALSFAAWNVAHAATPESFQGLKIEVVGKGRPVLMIPGLNSAGETWGETCAALQADHVQCHIVTLPGFAGLAPVADASKDAWLADMRDRLLAYVESRKLRHPVVMGHSLGGFLALQMAIRQPAAFERLVIVDSLAFLGAVQNPAATAESVKPMAEAMRSRMRAQDDASYRAGVSATLKGLVHDPARVELLTAWGNASDRAITSEAMYEMMTIDLRDQLDRVRVPTLVLGAWAAYAPYGSTKESTAAIYRAQYARLAGVRIEMSEGGYHFLMWDDPQWLQSQVRGFLDATPVTAK
ncbi:alpha/beta hydrolase [Lysobacter sp. Root494]|uniref:alpha/beta fold hydrolase n=1 Tax=Lysobacter sp. Root494 TaxID=1736549 RepID=UPI0006F9F091|nr:alpha/beta hydrolase [Lysobacter sp. Root494]KQY55090.1 alpha/beta hydrolase [Lysobacter sp. Root494]